MEKETKERKIELTADGSHTLFIPSMDEHYHSVNGAIQEARHVFLQAGLHEVQTDKIRILEIGFGTGLNAFLTLQEAARTKKQITYYTIERFPLPKEITDVLNYGELIWPEYKNLFHLLHAAAWDEDVAVTDFFTLHKIQADSNHCDLPPHLDLIYFDAFAPDKQPEMWSPEIFQKIYANTSPEGVIVTYCAKGEVRRNMQHAGFAMQRLPGPPGKRHMLFGRKRIYPFNA
ncbi:SAM-dependent methyltransferase [Parabacteroides sp. 52]|uniref:tRNA (5-methylaminomethyl-2-thiouridine)(34)-methyltransferase MnmD n=1 Tax=unclassified Parabacteroides TaxID=2649774 RepID=UPI0013D37976|nr:MULTISPECIES: tRNA (5-methylaminomethyl-2-thiouridine)(34)-methyltransferase MnmD [unclassified Parabacteroides]NDV56190.1 SAM-dependent methyltransferase [Parabacteroides sp. 52]